METLERINPRAQGRHQQDNASKSESGNRPPFSGVVSSNITDRASFICKALYRPGPQQDPTDASMVITSRRLRQPRHVSARVEVPVREHVEDGCAGLPLERALRQLRRGRHRRFRVQALQPCARPGKPLVCRSRGRGTGNTILRVRLRDLLWRLSFKHQPGPRRNRRPKPFEHQRYLRPPANIASGIMLRYWHMLAPAEDRVGGKRSTTSSQRHDSCWYG